MILKVGLCNRFLEVPIEAEDLQHSSGHMLLPVLPLLDEVEHEGIPRYAACHLTDNVHSITESAAVASHCPVKQVLDMV